MVKMKPTIFISYSNKDEAWKDSLRMHLDVLGKQGLIEVWDDSRIMVGYAWAEEIEGALARATVAVILISKHSLTSNFILTEEFPKILERRESEGLIVMPVILSPCPWRQLDWLVRLQVRPKNGEPIVKGAVSEQEEKMSAIAEEIIAILAHRSASLNKDLHVPEDGDVTSPMIGMTTLHSQGIVFNEGGFLSFDMVKSSLSRTKRHFILSGLTNRNYCSNIEFYNLILSKAKRNPNFLFELVFLHPRSPFMDYAKQVKRSPTARLAKQIATNAQTASQFYNALANNVKLYYLRYPLVIPFVREDDVLHVSWAFRSSRESGLLQGTVDAPYFTVPADSDLGKKIILSTLADAKTAIT